MASLPMDILFPKLFMTGEIYVLKRGEIENLRIPKLVRIYNNY